MGRLGAALVLLMLGGCAGLPTAYERSESFALADTAATPLGRQARDALLAHPGQSGCRPLPNGVDALVVRLLLADTAERSLDVQYYIWHDDLTGRLFADALLSLDTHPNIEIRLFNPVASRSFRGLGMLTELSRVNRRMHHKAFVADGVFWGKVHVLVDDPAKVSRPPEDTEGHMSEQFRRLGQPLRSELLIVSPYFVPGDAGVAALRSLVRQGIDVSVLTNSLAATDVGTVHAGYQRYREALLEAGVRLYELKPGAIDFGKARRGNRPTSGSRASLHAKTSVFDRRAVFIGSLNLDPRSVRLNTEIGVVCESEPMARAMAAGIEANIDQIAWRVERELRADGSAGLFWLETTGAGIVRHDKEPGVSGWRLLGVCFLGLLPIESQL